MATYLVRKRVRWGDGSMSAPGEVLELDPADQSTAVLLSRDLITPVPSDYPAATPKVASAPRPVGKAKPQTRRPPISTER